MRFPLRESRSFPSNHSTGANLSSYILQHVYFSIDTVLGPFAVSCEAAWKVAYYRNSPAAQLARTSNARGSMMAVGMPAVDMDSHLRALATELGADSDTRNIACINGPQ